MAKLTATVTTGSLRKKNHKRRPGIHSKCRTSKLKSSKHYVKRYRGQGR